MAGRVTVRAETASAEWPLQTTGRHAPPLQLSAEQAPAAGASPAGRAATELWRPPVQETRSRWREHGGGRAQPLDTARRRPQKRRARRREARPAWPQQKDNGRDSARSARSHPPAGRSTPRQDAGDSQIGGGSNQRKPGGSEQMSFLVDANRRRRKRSHTHAKIRPPYLTRISAYLRVSLRIWPPQRAQIRSSGAVSGGIWLPPVAQIRADTRRYAQIRARYARPSAPFSCAKHVISERPHRLRNFFWLFPAIACTPEVRAHNPESSLASMYARYCRSCVCSRAS